VKKMLQCKNAEKNHLYENKIKPLAENYRSARETEKEERTYKINLKFWPNLYITTQRPMKKRILTENAYQYHLKK